MEGEGCFNSGVAVIVATVGWHDPSNEHVSQSTPSGSWKHATTSFWSTNNQRRHVGSGWWIRCVETRSLAVVRDRDVCVCRCRSLAAPWRDHEPGRATSGHSPIMIVHMFAEEGDQVGGG